MDKLSKNQSIEKGIELELRRCQREILRLTKSNNVLRLLAIAVSIAAAFVFELKIFDALDYANLSYWQGRAQYWSDAYKSLESELEAARTHRGRWPFLVMVRTGESSPLDP